MMNAEPVKRNQLHEHRVWECDEGFPCCLLCELDTSALNDNDC